MCFSRFLFGFATPSFTIFFLILSATFELRGQVSLVAYYPLDGIAVDAWTNGLNGAVSGSPDPVEDRKGNTWSAMSFDGATEFIDLQNRREFNFDGDFSIAIWVNLSANAPERYMVAKYDLLSASPHSYGLGTDGASRAYAFVSHSDAGSASGPYVEAMGGPGLADGKWHFLVMTYEQSFGLKLYVDGELAGSVEGPNAPPFVNDVPLIVGGAAHGQLFPGTVDELRIYRGALSGQEVKTLFSETPQVGITILQQPESVFIETGTSGTFAVEIGGTNASAARCQWFEDGMLIPGATNATYTTPIQDVRAQKYYEVEVTDGQMWLQSGSALLFVSLPGELGLLAHWTFDEEFGAIVPEKTGRFDGSNVHGVRISGRVGTGALALNGTNAFVKVGGESTILGLTNTHYTIAWWQKWNGPGSRHQNILAMDDGEDYSGGYQAFIFQQSALIEMAHWDGQVTGDFIEGGETDGEWRHYAMVYDGAEVRVYGDGLLVGLSARDRAIRQDGNDPFIIGGLALQNGTITNLFNGSLDDIRIYLRALSLEEVRAIGPEPEIVILEHPRSYRAAQGQTITLSARVSTKSLERDFTFQWERDGVMVDGATDQFLRVMANGGVQKYRLRVRVGELEVWTDEVTIETVNPSGGNLLLHLDFESNDGDRFVDITNGIVAIGSNVSLVPGRVGRYAAELNGGGFIRVPAAGTDLELVGVSYTIAWWMNAGTNIGRPPQQIFTMGRRETTGYGARLDGTSIGSLRFEHRNGGNSTLTSPFRATNWIHVAVVYDGQRRTVYQNGVLTNILPSISAPILGSARDDLLIGADATNNLQRVGLLDDFRIYNYALAGEEIQELANMPAAPLRLEVGQVDGRVSIRWPTSEGAQSRVEFASTLEGEALWIPLNTPAEVVGFYNQIYHVATNQLRFYRLRKL